MRRSLFLFKSSQRSTGQVEVQTKCQNTHRQYSSKLLFSLGLLFPLIGALLVARDWEWNAIGNWITLSSLKVVFRPGLRKMSRTGWERLTCWSSGSSLLSLLGSSRKWKENQGTKERSEEKDKKARGKTVALEWCHHPTLWVLWLESHFHPHLPIGNDIFSSGSAVLQDSILHLISQLSPYNCHPSLTFII